MSHRNPHCSKALTPAVPKLIRCAIYTRKSSEEGLALEFNSLDAQRESAQAFIASQRNEGWTALPDRYDDRGFSGGNIERPGLSRLMKDIVSGKVDCVVVYKVDRLSRSLMDFARIMQVFDEKKVSFVSVTQQFNTTHSMGRLTLNILLSFAQFEREIIGERIRDKIAAQRRKGKWTGGAPVLGYDVDRSGPSPKLMLNAIEAARVVAIFNRAVCIQQLIQEDQRCFRQHSFSVGEKLSLAKLANVKWAKELIGLREAGEQILESSPVKPPAQIVDQRAFRRARRAQEKQVFPRDQGHSHQINDFIFTDEGALHWLQHLLHQAPARGRHNITRWWLRAYIARVMG